MIAARRAKALAIRAASGAKRCMRDFPLNGLSTRFDLPGSGETIYCGAPLQKAPLGFHCARRDWCRSGAATRRLCGDFGCVPAARVTCGPLMNKGG